MTIPPDDVNWNVLAARLRTLRIAAGLSGNALAKQIGIPQSRQWRFENGALLPSEHEIREWVRVTGGQPDTADELISMLADMRIEYHTFKTAFRTAGGTAAYQAQVMAIEQRATRIGEFQIAVIPAILQTADYARELLSLPSGPKAWGVDDRGIEELIATRLQRQEALYDAHKRVQVVLGEAALRTLVCSPQTLARQLEKLLAVTKLPALELGVIGFSQPMPVFPFTAFSVRDDDLVIVESVAGEQYIRAENRADEVASFMKFFDLLRGAARTGPAAAAIIEQALSDLQGLGD